jgi:periplasmic copper chaperone A
MKRTALFVVSAIGLVVVAQAGAHAEITPKKLPAASTSTFVLSVAGEESAPTVKVAVQLPPGLSNVKPAPVRGWQANFGGNVITWTGGTIRQGQNGEFEIAALLPDTPGRTLKFPTVQTYGNGTVVRWIGAPSSEMPAPTIELTAARATPPPPPVTEPPPTTTAAAPESDDDSGSTGWLIGAVVLVVLIGAAAALLWRRRS